MRILTPGNLQIIPSMQAELSYWSARSQLTSLWLPIGHHIPGPWVVGNCNCRTGIFLSIVFSDLIKLLPVFSSVIINDNNISTFSHLNLCIKWYILQILKKMYMIQKQETKITNNNNLIMLRLGRTRSLILAGRLKCSKRWLLK